MKHFILALLSLLLLAAAPAFASTLSVTVDHGETLSLESPAASVFIANPDIADVQVLSPTQIMVFGKRTGETTFMATDGRGVVLAERTIVVSQDLSNLRQEIKYAIPGNDIGVKAVPGGIILTGTARDSASVADAYKIAMRYLPQGGDIINRVQVTGSNQIHIRVRFAEVQRNIDNSMGFNWQNILSAGGMVVGFGTGNTVNTTLSGASSSSAASGIFPRPNNTSLGTANDVLGISGTTGKWNINGMIDALEQEGLLTILAEPNLTAMSGETANFLAGGQFPIPIPQDNGAITVQFQSYGISLAFTPTVLSGDRISLHVRPEVSELTDVGTVTISNISIPALTTRKAETTVEVASGESFAIAGLMNNKQSQAVNKFPMLGDLPIIGALFRSSHFVNGQTELVVIITPYIVRPSKSQLALPTDGYAPPTDRERYVNYRYSSGDPKARTVSGAPVGAKKLPSAKPAAAPATAAPEKTAPAPQPQAQAPQTTTNLTTKPQPEEAAPAAPAPSTAAKKDAAPAVEENPGILLPATTNLKLKTEPPPETKKPAPPATPQAKAAPSPKTPAKAAAPKQKAKAPASKPKQPLVLHTTRDGDESSGGLLVE